MALDSRLSSEAVAAIVDQDERFKICSTTSADNGLADVVRVRRPDLLLFEFLPELGTDLITKLRSIAPTSRVLVVSRFAERVYAERALRAGAHGYFLKRESAAQLLGAIEDVLCGSTYVSAALELGDHVRSTSATSADLKLLSDRELQVLAAIAAGSGTGAIAKQLGISRKTVETHCENIKNKLNLPDASALKSAARELVA